MIVRVGLGSCGIAAGGNEVYQNLSMQIEEGNWPVRLEATGCIGMCYLEPLIDMVLDNGVILTYGNIDPGKALDILIHHLSSHEPVDEYLVSSSLDPTAALNGQVRVALQRCGRINPESIDDYIACDGYQALQKVLKMTPEDVITEIKKSGLSGRGGAGFPTWFKWDSTRKEHEIEKYVICNADEGDPGAFMDRSLLEGDPHAILEGMTIAAYATGAARGIIYVRAEYPLAIKRLQIAIDQSRERGFLGNNLLDSTFDFQIMIKQGAGAFVCGEETALIASLEGERGMPRLKPPFPSQHGYWGKPTTINNVETLANVPWIILHGAERFAAMGTENSKGTKVFALAGKIKHGGLIEVPMGISLHDIIYTIGGGIKEDRPLKAVQLGGPSGGCIPASMMDTAVDYETIKDTGAIMGSGGMIIMDESTCMVDIARYFLHFTQDESCGKCVPCRVGTRRMLELLENICAGEGAPGDLERLETLARGIKDSSLCGLGQSAPNPVLTTLKYFRAEYLAHLVDQKCPAHHCKALLTYTIDPEKCVGCTLCVKKCPVQCITGQAKEVHVIDQEMCIKCGNCLEACPTKFNAVVVD